MFGWEEFLPTREPLPKLCRTQDMARVRRGSSSKIMKIPSASVFASPLWRAFSTLALTAAAVLLGNSEAAAAPGDIYVANFLTSSIDIITSGSGVVFADDSSFGNPNDIAFDASGNLYVANAPNTITRYTPAGVASVFADASSGLNSPFGLAFDSKGNLFVANSSDSGDNILKFTSEGVASVFADSSKGVAEPLGLAVDASDNLFVANEGEENILRITPAGVSTVFAATGTSGLEYPFGLAFDASGNLFVVNNADGGPSILRFTPSGVGSVFATDGLRDPQDLAFDAAGNLYVTDEQGFVEMYSPGGAPSLFYSSGGGYPVGIAAMSGSSSTTSGAELTLSVSGNASVVEGTIGKAAIHRTGDTSTALTVRYKVVGGAKAGKDYKPLSGSVVIPAGITQVKIKLKTIDNQTVDGTRVAKIKLLPATDGSYALGSPDAAKIKITDND